MGKIIAIGGGEIGRPRETGKGNYPVETLAIDKEIIKLSGKKKPRLLFVPTASGDSEGYCRVIQKHFGQRLGCSVDFLLLKKEKYTRKELETKILSSDIIYVGGGNTLKMMTLWRRLGVDKILLKAYKKGIVLSGLSAGSVCWFSCCNSDSRKSENKNADLIKVNCLGFIDALNCPHYMEEKDREISLKNMMKKTHRIVSIALTKCCALEVVDGEYRVIVSDKSAGAYRVYWKRKKYFKERIPISKEFNNLKDLLKK